MDVRLKRVYDDPEPDDGVRILVDRLWPRGMTQERAVLDSWSKDVAPSPALRAEWHAHLERWDEFADQYRTELATNVAAEHLRSYVRTHPHVTLLYGAKDREHNHAVVLAEYLTAA
ncbi:DUF488 domain-containing protein [Agromyces sp. SYSU T00194]|uniref:DUF488 domain-containing protein n=1 Tax=Agromyces chitinivorans TaxID=3158560 RepID=UPI00339915B4